MYLKRGFSTFSVRLKSLKDLPKPGSSLLRGIDFKELIKEDPLAIVNKKKPKSNTHPLPPAHLGKICIPITGPVLNAKYQLKDYKKPTPAEISHVNHFFNIAKKKLNWCVYKYQDIPGEGDRLAREKELIDSMEHIEEQDQGSTDDLLVVLDEFGEQSLNEQNRIAKIEKKRLAIESENALPEVLFVGRCNVGKSSTINGLFNDLTRKKKSDFKYAKVKDFPGLTPSLNFFNLGGLLRIVDSPGYGMKGKPWQGELTLDYILNRRNLKKVYIVVSFKEGVKETDQQIIEFLLANRIQFDFIITKIDQFVQKLSRDQYMHRIDNFLLANLKIDNEPILRPNFHFVNNVVAKLHKRTGLQELRVDILKTCGYENVINLKPKYVIDPRDLDQQLIRKVGEMDEIKQKNLELEKALKKAKARMSGRGKYPLDRTNRKK